MKKILPVNFLQWSPDKPPYAMEVGELVVCRNVYPVDNGSFMFFPEASNYSTGTVSGTPLSGKEVIDDAGDKYLFIGTSSKLYRLNTNKTLTDFSKAGSYTTGSNTWSHVAYGQWVISSNYADAPQIKKTIDNATAYADLGGSPPKYRYAVLYHNHLVAAYLNEGGTVEPKKTRWSAYKAVEDWSTTTPGTGSDSEIIEDSDGEEITGMALMGDSILYTFDRSMTLAYYARHPYTLGFVMNWQVNKGAYRNTLISVGKEVFCIGQQDIFKVNEAEGAVAIGSNVKGYILSRIDTNNLHRITTAHDTRRNAVMWALPMVGGNGTPSVILAYNYVSNKYTLIEENIACLFNIKRAALDFDTIDAIWPSADDIPYSFDDNFWLASTTFAGVNNSGQVVLFIGNAKQAYLETGEIFLPETPIISVNRIEPFLEQAYGNVACKIGYRRLKATRTVTFTANSNMSATTGFCDIRIADRHIRIGMTVDGAHSGITGAALHGRMVGAL